MLWNNYYETGLPTVDEQHKELFTQLDILLDPSKKDRTKETLDFLGKYVIKHFGHEQALHAKTAYPKAAEHKKLHDDFTAAFKDLKKQLEGGGEGGALPIMKLTKMTTDWLKDHILGPDKDFAKYCKENNKM